MGFSPMVIFGPMVVKIFGLLVFIYSVIPFQSSDPVSYPFTCKKLKEFWKYLFIAIKIVHQEQSSLQWSFKCFSCRFYPTGVCSDYTSSFYLRHS